MYFTLIAVLWNVYFISSIYFLALILIANVHAYQCRLTKTLKLQVQFLAEK